MHFSSNFCFTSILLLCLCLVIPTAALQPSKTDDDDNDDSNVETDDRTLKPKKVEKCGIYLAPSTIPGAGMGMYAGHVTYEPGDVVSDSDLVVPIFELDWHNGHRHFSFLWNEYAWTPGMFEGMEQELEDVDSMHACSGGFGAAVNCRLNLVNVEDTEGTWGMGMSGVSSESPGAGAFTPYYGRQFQATRRIPPGMEFYASYGESYFTSRDAYYMVPVRKSYKTADQFLKRFRAFRQQVPALNQESSQTGDQLSEALYDFILNDLPFKSRTIYALPTNFSQIDYVMMSTGGTSNATYNESIRDLDWLEEHGQCMDNIKDGISTRPHAGRGAFANRFIPKGGLVAPLPLIHVGDRNILTMYENLPEDETGMIRRNASSPFHKQLLLNYCFGHADMSLLLCPYGLLTALINHSHQQPNAKIVWTQNVRHPEWLNESYHLWHNTKHTGLSFDVVAVRDIREDEEILIDYGAEWETAWQEHRATFDSPRRGRMPAFEMNEQVDLQIKTIHEIDYESIEGIFTFCRRTIVDMVLGEEDALYEDEDFRLEVNDLEGEGCYPCRVVHRNHNDSYIAELFSRETKDHKSGMWKVETDTVGYILFDVPRDTFYFHDAFYQRDHHQYWSFRHDMRIPDEIMPDAWRDSSHPVSNGNITGSTDEWLDDDIDEDSGGDSHDEKAVGEDQVENKYSSHSSNKKETRKKSEGSSAGATSMSRDEL